MTKTEQESPDQEPGINRTNSAGRLSFNEWQQRVRYMLRHLHDPITLQKSPVCKLAPLDNLARARYPDSVFHRGKALNDLVVESLGEIESEMDGYTGLTQFRLFTGLIIQGKGTNEISREMGMSAEHISRSYKRKLVLLVAQKLLMKLRVLN